MEKFKTEVKLEVYRASEKYGKDFYINGQNITIEWGLEMDMRNWGLKDLHIFVPDQKISYTLTECTEEDDIETDHSIELKDIKVEYDDAKFKYGLSPQSISLNLLTGVVEVEF